MLSLDGPDKWSLDRGFEKEIVSGGLISDLRMFLSVNGLLDHVTKLRRCSGIIKLQPVWYMATGRERTPHQKCWIHRICSGGKENPHDHQIWRTCTRFKTLWSCTEVWKS
jgi:hypothetical protein